MPVVSEMFQGMSRRARAWRAHLFRTAFRLDEHTRLLDLGSEDGRHIHSVLEGTPVRPQNVFIADIAADAVRRGAERYGFQPVVLDESGRLPFADQFFDIVHCSSVIEHVTLPKDRVWSVRSGRAFRHAARERQSEFARELIRVSRSYFVQTPHKAFPIESHSWLPFVGYLPRTMLLAVLRLTNRIWIKQTAPDWHLLGHSELAELFSDAAIVYERVWGLPKSIIALRAPNQRAQRQ